MEALELDDQSVAELPDRVAASLSGKTVLLTGATGFLGKVLLEKLLRMCPDIKQIILLIRTKKGKDPKQRLELLLQGELFAPLLESRGLEYLLSRTRAVSGDVSEDNLALSVADRETCRQANVIVHSAASVRFDEGLKKTILLNTRGTKDMLDLAKECPELELFIYVSTAYCHPQVRVLEERTYPPPADPRQLIELMESTDDDRIAAMTPKLLGAWPNAYAYSKALSEALVAEVMDALPVMIVRPSVVVPVLKEPLPGWTDNINGPAGLLIAAGKGVLRTMYGDNTLNSDFIPVDMYASGVLIVAWNCLQNGDTSRKVMNFTSSDEIIISWSELVEAGRKVIKEKVPFNNVAWYPGGSMTRSRLWHNIRMILFHWAPAMLVDTLLFCLGIKPVLLRVQRRISMGMVLFEYYTSNQWEFKSDVKRHLRDKLNARELALYKVDIRGFDLEEYMEHCILALRRYILKETDDTLPAARRRMFIMRCLDLAVKAIFGGLVVYWLYVWILSFGTGRINLSSSADESVITLK